MIAPSGAADQRGDPEQPELADGPAAGEEGRAGRARRVHRGVGDRDRDEVDQGERKADGEGGEALRCTPVRGAEDHEEEARR